MGRRSQAVRELAAATRPDRNRYVDLLRVTSIGVVVLGHWLMVVIGWEDGRIVGGHLLEEAPRFRILTWIFQVMPVFFIVGGYANAASWESALRRGVGYAMWLRIRAGRLLRPTVGFVAVWTVLVMVLRLTALDAELLRTGGRLVAVPLWFLAVYLLVVPAAPIMLAAHRRYRWKVPVVLGILALGIDAAHWGWGVPLVGWVNFACVWLAVHQLGYFWRDGYLDRHPAIPWLLAGGGLAALVLLVGPGPYPLSMVGIDGGGRSNNFPPSSALVALGVWQAGLVLLLQRPANRWLRRPRVWERVVLANSMVMTVFLWHLTAMAFAVLALYPTGVWPRVAAFSTAWWLLRPIWVALLALALAPLVVLFWPLERAEGGGPRIPAWGGRGRWWGRR